MCLILLAHRVSVHVPVILAANRDEFFARPTAIAGFWPDAPQVLGGRDLEHGGTWMGVTRDGRWAAVTNFRDGSRASAGGRSRGDLVADYLRGDAGAAEYMAALADSAGDYHGFNLLLGDTTEAVYFSNRSGPGAGRAAPPKALAPGIYGLSNHLLDTPWPKVSNGKRTLGRLAQLDAEHLAEALLDQLADRTLADDADLPQTGVTQEWERLLSPMFITAPDYGTRASTVMLIDREGSLHFRERSFNAGGGLLDDRSFRIDLTPAPSSAG